MYPPSPLHLQSRPQKSIIISASRVIGELVWRVACVVNLLALSAVMFSGTSGLRLDVVGFAMNALDTATLHLLVPSHHTKGEQQTNRLDGITIPLSEGIKIPTSYVATAYSLRGKTASGRMVSRGLIAADPRVLPLGSRVRLEHPGYSGEYLVADTSDRIRGRRIDIWTPSAKEAEQFGQQTVKLTVLSDAAHSPVLVRERLEKLRQENAITDSEYRTQYANWERLTKESVASFASYYANHQEDYDSATHMPGKEPQADPNEKDLHDTYSQRLILGAERARGLISQSEHDVKLAALEREENLIASRGIYSPASVARYYQYVAAIPAIVGTLMPPPRWTIEQVVTLTALLLGIALPFYLGHKKDLRERSTLALEKRKLELAERSSLLEVEELRLKIAQLEQQLADSSKRLIIP